jgi:hypothetical protein
MRGVRSRGFESALVHSVQECSAIYDPRCQVRTRDPAAFLVVDLLRSVSYGPDVDLWLSSAVDVIAATSGVPRAGLDLSDADVERLLELARVAAHESGERTNAPLICYLVGWSVAVSGKTLEDVAAAVPGAGG